MRILNRYFRKLRAVFGGAFRAAVKDGQDSRAFGKASRIEKLIASYSTFRDEPKPILLAAK
jgi:hypothetical protein